MHTVTSPVYPTGAQHMPFDQAAAFRAGSRSVTLNNPGLYVFVCKVHPFMLAATIVDDPATAGSGSRRKPLSGQWHHPPITSDLATRLLRAFWLITNPANYQDHNVATNPLQTWTIDYPNGVPVRLSGGAVVDLKNTLEARTETTCRWRRSSSRHRRALAKSGSTPRTRTRPANRSPARPPPWTPAPGNHQEGRPA